MKNQILLLLMFSMIGCQSSQNEIIKSDLIGRWSSTTENFITFHENGDLEFKYFDDASTFQGNWHLDDNIIFLKFDDKNGFEYDTIGYKIIEYQKDFFKYKIPRFEEVYEAKKLN